MLWILSTTYIIVAKSDEGHDDQQLGVVQLPSQLELFNYFSNITWAERLVQFLSVGRNECTTISLLSVCVPMFFFLAKFRHFQTKKLRKFWSILK
jgi:hypothetical protein